MYARSSTVTAHPSAIEEGIAFVRDEVWPAMHDMDGCIGLSMLVDRATGQGIVTSSWRDLESMRASAGQVLPMRERAVQLMDAGTPTVQEWEIVSMHRDHHSEPGTWVRAAWSRVAPSQAGPAIDFYKFVLLPEIQQMDGFVSASLMVDRATGRGVTSVAYDSRASLEAARDKADYLRGASTNEAGVEFLDVGEYELVLAHLHVPELV